MALWLPKKLWQPQACPGAFAGVRGDSWGKEAPTAQQGPGGRYQAPPGSGPGSTPHTDPVCPEPRVCLKPTHACAVNLSPCKTKAPTATLSRETEPHRMFSRIHCYYFQGHGVTGTKLADFSVQVPKEGPRGGPLSV